MSSSEICGRLKLASQGEKLWIADEFDVLPPVALPPPGQTS